MQNQFELDYQLEELFWKKYRPRNIEDIVLLDRVRDHVKNGLHINTIFCGSFGMGKTVLSKMFLSDSDMAINASLHTSIDVLRNSVSRFCSTYDVFSNREHKMVLFDELDRVSPEFQDALKGFIEENEDRVRFIATTNHIDKITDGIKSRLMVIDFNPKNSDEVNELKTKYVKRLQFVCSQESGLADVSEDDLKQIVNYNFPDMRKMVTTLQEISLTGKVIYVSSVLENEVQNELYEILHSDCEYFKIYEFVLANFANNNIDSLLKALGRPYIDYVYREKRDKIAKLPLVIDIVNTAMSTYSTHTDPFILSISTIHNINKTLK